MRHTCLAVDRHKYRRDDFGWDVLRRPRPRRNGEWGSIHNQSHPLIHLLMRALGFSFTCGLMSSYVTFPAHSITHSCQQGKIKLGSGQWPAIGAVSQGARTNGLPGCSLWQPIGHNLWMCEFGETSF